MPLLDICNLAIHFHTEGGVVEAVKGISLTLEKGEEHYHAVRRLVIAR